MAVVVREMDPADFIRKVVYWVTMAVNLFLGLRFLLRLFNANVASDFVAWVYENTQPLLEPFLNIFPNTRLEGGFTIEFSTLFAIVVYALIGFLVLALVDALTPARTIVKKK
ncbi:YggT family protein [Candidatus Microgenomates bacterium]|nr:YggT family protein [Candidatus Microgenomates bacterium]